MEGWKAMCFTKYIRHDTQGIVLFNALANVSHKQMAQALLAQVGGRIVSAGFVVWSVHGRPWCSGVSESLHLHSLPEDTAILTAQLGLPAAPAPATPAPKATA